MIKSKKKVMVVQGSEIAVAKVNGHDYISLTGIVQQFPDGKFLVGKWMSRKSTIEFVGLWEQLHNPDFKVTEFGNFKNNAGSPSFSLSPQRWIEQTNAIGIISKSGKTGGTYAHQDIAFEFASWLSPEFKLFLIKEFQRLKEEEQKGLAWDVRRLLSKVNYKLHTAAIKDVLIPLAKLPKEREGAVYADEAEMFNLIVFGKTAMQWRKENPQAHLRGENIRDHASLLQLTVLSNLENLNSTYIREGMKKAERYAKLKKIAQQQLQNLISSQGQLAAFEEQARNDSSTMQEFKANMRGLAKLPPPNA